MLKKRIIPCLDVKDGRVVKGINFVDLIDYTDGREVGYGLEVKQSLELEKIFDIANNLCYPDTSSNLIDNTIGGALKDWKINFFGLEENFVQDEQRFDENLLTGCLTLLDMDVKNIDISVEKSTCEDAVNFIRVSGHVNKIDIQHTHSDGLDLDYSDLSFAINVYYSS